MNYRFVFARKGYNKEGKALVQLRVTIARQSKFFSTGIYLDTTQIYAKITRDKLASDMQSLAGKLKGDKNK